MRRFVPKEFKGKRRFYQRRPLSAKEKRRYHKYQSFGRNPFRIPGTAR